MFTFTQAAIGYQETVTDGLKLWINGKKVMEVDANWYNIPEAAYDGGGMYLMFGASYKGSAGKKPGLYSEITAWERALNASEIAGIYYHGMSPSPMRIRGGLNRQLGRMI